MEKNKNILPYIITIYGVLETESNEIKKMKEELRTTNINYLINKADAVYVEADEEELKTIKENKDYDLKNRIKVKLDEIKLIEIRVTKEDIINLNTKNINGALVHLRKDVRNSQGKLKITFSKWDDIHKFYEVEEIKKFVGKVFEENPDIFYYLTEEQHNCKMILACMSKLKNKVSNEDNTVTLDFCIPDETTVKIMCGITRACKYDDEKAMKIIDKLFNEELVKEWD